MASSAYHIREALPSDYWMGMAPYTWKRVPQETAWGRRQVLHVFEPDRPGQTRGKSGIAAILTKSKTLERFQDVNLEAAIVNAMYAAVIESEFDHAQVAEALGTVKEGSELASAILTAMPEYHSAGTVRFDGVKIPHLYPGEGFIISCAIFPGTTVFIFLRFAGKNCTRGNIVSSEHPGPRFAEFEKSVIRRLAAGRQG